MARLRGRGIGVGMALGTAVVARTRNGIPLLPEVPPRIAELLAGHRTTELPDVVLVAEDYRTALTLAGMLSWAQVVGIAAASADPDAPVSNLPAVVGVENLMETVEDDMLMLVDAERGLVLADPDGFAIAQYQAEHDHIAPKRRLYLDAPHQPARTLDSRTILTYAMVENVEDVQRALTDGADALYVPFNVELLPADADEAQAHRALMGLIDLAPGKPLVIADDYALPLTALLEAAGRADLTLAVPMREDLERYGVGELAGELAAAEADCFETEMPCGIPRLAAQITGHWWQEASEQDAARIDRLAAEGATRLFVFPLTEPGRVVTMTNARLARLEAMTATATTNLMPVAMLAHEMVFPRDTPQAAITKLVGAGMSGLILAPDAVSVAKETIDELYYGEARDDLRVLLEAGENDG